MGMLKREVTDANAEFANAIERLDNAICKAEGCIRLMKLGIEGEVKMGGGEFLVWGYVTPRCSGSSRRLFIQNQRPIDQCNIKLKREVAAAIPDLIAILKANRFEKAVQIFAVADRLDEFCDELDAKRNAQQS